MRPRRVRTHIMIASACWIAAAVVAVDRVTMNDDSKLAQAATLIEKGDFAAARTLLADRSDTPDAATARRRDDQIEIMRRIRLDFDTTEAQMLDRIRRDIPDATPDDLHRWRDQDVLQHRVIDGQVWYFDREPVNLFRFCDEARKRRDAAAQPSPAAGPEWNQNRYLADLVAKAAETDAVELGPVHHRVTYSLALDPKPGRLKSGSRVRLWLPYPQEYRQQKDLKLIRTTPLVTMIAPNGAEARDGQLQRTLYFEQRVENPADRIRVEAVYEFTTYAYVPKLDPAKVKPYDTGSALYRTFTAERPPHIVFTPPIRDVVRRETAGADNPLERARKLFHWVSKNIRYAAEVEYSTIPSLANRAMHRRKGDCGIQATTFVTLCRAAGVPARWQSGWETRPGLRNMHDWCEFYVEPWGWLPADPSYGLQESDDPRVREFFFGHMDAFRMICNLDYGCPLLPPKESFRSEPIDFQRGEVEVDGENLYFDEWNYRFTYDWSER